MKINKIINKENFWINHMFEVDMNGKSTFVLYRKNIR